MSELIFIKCSKALLILSLTLHSIVLMSLVMISMPFWIEVISLLLTCLSLLYWLFYFFRERSYRLGWDMSNKELVLFKGDGYEKLNLLAGSVVTEYYIALHGKNIDNNSKRYFILIKDAFESQYDFARLSAFMKQSIL